MNGFKEDIINKIINNINNRFDLEVTYIDRDGNSLNKKYNASELRKLDTDKLVISSGIISNYEDLMNGMVRFISDNLNEFIDIPLRNIYMFNDINNINDINIKELQGFSPVSITNIEIIYKDELNDFLKEILTLSKDYFNMNSQEKFMTIKRLDQINK